MIRQQAVEEGRVAILQRGQADVLLECVVLAAHVLPLQFDLLLDRLDLVRQQTSQPEGLTLVLAKGEVLGEEAGAQQSGATQVDMGRPTGDDRGDRFSEWLHRASCFGVERRGGAVDAAGVACMLYGRPIPDLCRPRTIATPGPDARMRPWCRPRLYCYSRLS